MLGFTKVAVSSFDLDTFVISWEVETNPATRPLTDFQYFVDRATAEEGPFDTLNATPLVDVYVFTDTQVNRLSKWRKFYYRIRAVDTTGGFPTTTTSSVQAATVDTLTMQQRVRLEIIRTERLLLRGNGISPGFVTSKYLVYNRRTFGQRCTVCWDAIKKTVQLSNCVNCFGVGFTNGYHTPILTYVASSPSTDEPSLTPLGESQINIIRVWTSNYPNITAGDVLVDGENRRWVVRGRKSTENVQMAIRQLLTLHQIDPGDIEYQIPVDGSLLRAA